MSNVQSYNALIDRFKAFASGHFILKRFSHGQIEVSDLEKFGEYPFMHVVPSNVTYAKGMKTFSFQIVLADLPRDKEDKTEYQREVLSDLQRIAEDLIAEITNHRVLFGDLITVQNVSLEPFLEEFQHTLTGWTISLDLLVPYYWDACSIPAEWNDYFETGTGGTGSILSFADSITQDENGVVTLINDEANPSPHYYYGTNDEGVRGWYLLTDNIGLTCVTLPTCQTIIDIEAAIDALQIDVALKANTADISVVGFSNNYNDLSNKPTIPAAQVNSDWNATSGVSQILNKPSLATVAISGSYTDLTNKPIIPAAQVNSDWNATSGVAQILNKPTIPPAVTIDAVPTDGSNNAVSSNGTFDALATKFNNPTGTTADYLDGTGTPVTFPSMLSADKMVTVGRNSTGSTLYKGTVVYISGSTGNRPNFVKAQANSESTSAGTFGVVLADIANNSDGSVVTIGTIDNLDTRSNATNPFTTDTLADGDTIYLSPTTAGYVTNVKPSAPNHLVYVGKVVRTTPQNGTIVYRIQNGYELEELHNVAISSVANNQLLQYESATSLWKNKTIDKTTVGLGNVDNTSDANKPISTATQTALNLKENSANKQNSLDVDGTGVKFPTVDAVNNLSMIDRGKRILSVFSDFIGGVVNLDGIVTYTSGSVMGNIGSGIPNRTNQQGVQYYNTLTGATNYAIHASLNSATIWFGGGAWNFETSINIANLSDITNRFRFISGFGSNAANTTEGDGVFFTYDEGGTLNGTAASPNWQCVTVANVVRTLTTTSIPVVNGAWIKLRIEINAAGTSVAFYVNGTLAATHTTNIPLASNNRYVLMKQGMFKTIGLTNRVIYVDYLGYENILTTSR